MKPYRITFRRKDGVPKIIDVLVHRDWKESGGLTDEYIEALEELYGMTVAKIKML